MKRIAAHYVYCDALHIIPKGVVEITDEGFISAIFSLQGSAEIENTVFYNGVICIDFSSFYQEIGNEHPFILTNLKNTSFPEIASSLVDWQQLHPENTLWNILYSLIDTPLANESDSRRKLTVGNKVSLLLLEGIDYTKNQLLPQFSITSL